MAPVDSRAAWLTYGVRACVCVPLLGSLSRRDLVGHTGENAMEHEWYTGPVYTQPYLGPAGKHNGNLASKKNYKQGTGDTTAVAGGGNYED